jgi:hypothetical protein
MGSKVAGFPVLEQQEASAFATRVAKLLERVEYRRADSAQDKEAIFRMRYEAYLREGFIEPNTTGLFTDADDERPNTWLIAVYIDGALASSIRLHVASRPDQFLPVTVGFPEHLLPHLEAGDVIIDASRQTSRLEFTRAYPFMPLVTMRCGFLGMQYFDADILTGTCRSEYQPAFRRMFGSATWSTPRAYPPLTRMHVLMAYDCKTQWADTRKRYPFLTSTPQERRELFGRSSNVAQDLHDELTVGRRQRASEPKENSTTYAA